MKDAGCPFLRARISSTCGAAVERYWTSLGFTQYGKDHSRCSSISCVANDLNVAKYVTRHANKDCDCAFLEPDGLTIKEIYSQGSFPLVAIEVDGFNNIQVRTKPYNTIENTPFIAISHALSGGLGNPVRPALPTCQLLQIDKWIRGAYKQKLPEVLPDCARVEAETGINNSEEQNTPTCWYWMDSLCIPSHTAIITQYDLRARRSFKRATSLSVATLVLDEDSLRLRSSSSLPEIYLRITTSSWFNRMWTLQEAVATPMVLFQTAEGSIDLDELVLRLEERVRNNNTYKHSDHNSGDRVIPRAELHLDLTPLHDLQELRRYMIDPSYEHLQGSDAHRLLLDGALSQRRTSHIEDRNIIWANLLDLIMPLSRQNSANITA